MEVVVIGEDEKEGLAEYISEPALEKSNDQREREKERRIKMIVGYKGTLNVVNQRKWNKERLG